MSQDWTRDPDTLTRIITTAIAQHDWQGVQAALTLLAAADPHRCADLVTVMKAGLILANER